MTRVRRLLGIYRHNMKKELEIQNSNYIEFVANFKY